eukprot:624394-Rhodomonas_salina.2
MCHISTPASTYSVLQHTTAVDAANQRLGVGGSVCGTLGLNWEMEACMQASPCRTWTEMTGCVNPSAALTCARAERSQHVGAEQL